MRGNEEKKRREGRGSERMWFSKKQKNKNASCK